MIVVSFALPAESSDFERAVKRFPQVRVLHTGVGEKAARGAVEKFFAAETPQLWISSGFTGALHDSLAVGELLLATNYSTAQLPGDFDVRQGRMTSAAAVLDSAADRARVAASTGAVAVDMETRWIAEACAARGVPLLALRAISDTPAAPFPAPPAVLFDLEKQRTSSARLAWYLARNPDALPRLLAFGRQVAVARRSLADGLGRLLTALPQA